MSRFFVGQRVRISRPDNGSKLRGLVTGDVGVVTDMCLLVDVYVAVAGRENPNLAGNEFPMYFAELDPILPEGHQPATQSHEQLMADLRKGVIHA